MTDKTKARRAQRAHTKQCLVIGAVQRLQHRKKQLQMQLLANSHDALNVMDSIAVHRNDCDGLQQEHHFAGTSNVSARNGLLKSKRTLKDHRRLHQQANEVSIM